MQPLAAGAQLVAYHRRLRSSHDFDVFVDVLDLNEKVIGSAIMLDGQVNITDDGLVRRTASLSLSDPEGAFDFTGAAAWNGTSLWVDTLARVRHVTNVPGYGEMTAVPFIGPPTSLSRSGGEVKVELKDKAALAMRGARPLTVHKGMKATDAIQKVMSYCTGEFRFRVPSLSRRLSRHYSVGLADDAAPMVVAARIAQAELGMQLLYSCDGYLTLRPRPSQPVAHMGDVTDLASSSADFSTVVNYVKVTGKAVSKKKGNKTTTTQAISTAQTKPSSEVSPERIARQGVPRLLPLVITDDGYTTTAQTARRASAELAGGAGVVAQPSVAVVPMFHLDADDIVTVTGDQGDTITVRLSTASIPLGVGGDMAIGFRRWVSSKALGKPRSHYTRSVKIAKHKKSAKTSKATKGAHK